MGKNDNIDADRDNEDFVYKDCTVCILLDSHTYIPWHTHGFYELVLVVEGFCFHHMQDAVSLIMEGDVLLIKPGVPHQYSGIRECKIINCLIKKEALTDDIMEQLLTIPELFRLDPDTDESFPQIHLEVRQRESLQKALEQIAKEYRNQNIGWQFKIKTLLYSMLVDYARYCNDYRKNESVKNWYSVYVNRTIQYVAEHYTEDLSVQGLADYVGVTPDYLSRQFRMTIGVALHDYIQRYRISRSLAYLQQGFSIGEIAEKCGFASLAYFSRVFKKEMGLSPTFYLQQLKEKA